MWFLLFGFFGEMERITCRQKNAPVLWKDRGVGSAPERAGYDGKNHQYGNHQTYDPNKGGLGVLVVFVLSGHTEPSRNSKYTRIIPSFT